MGNTGRTHDIMELYRLWEHEPNPGTKENIMHSISVIKNESRLIRSMRESLVKAHRNNAVEEIKDIHEFIKNKQRYQNS